MLLHCRAARPELPITLTQGQTVSAVEHQYPTSFLPSLELGLMSTPRGGRQSSDQEGVESEELHGRMASAAIAAESGFEHNGGGSMWLRN